MSPPARLAPAAPSLAADPPTSGRITPDLSPERGDPAGRTLTLIEKFTEEVAGRTAASAPRRVRWSVCCATSTGA